MKTISMPYQEYLSDLQNEKNDSESLSDEQSSHVACFVMDYLYIILEAKSDGKSQAIDQFKTECYPYFIDKTIQNKVNEIIFALAKDNNN